MKKTTAILSQIGAILAILMSYNVIPSKYTNYVAAGAAVASVVVTNLASNKNPDGTPAELPYVKSDSDGSGK